MRIPTGHLQQFAIFTTLLTGVGVGTMYYLIQKKFSGSEWHRLALQKLESCPAALEGLGVPPLKVSNIHLTDAHNRVDLDTAQMKIPVAGSKTGAYLYTSSVRDQNTNRWSLQLATLKLREGRTIDLLNPPSPPAGQSQDTGLSQGLDAGPWH